MKNTDILTIILVGIVMIFISPLAQANTVFQQVGTVTNVSPMYGHTQINQQLPEKVRVCYKRDANGLLEEVSTGLFGSNQGLIGGTVGYVIAEELGANDAGRIIASMIGNKIGNDFDHRKQSDECRIETRMTSHPTIQQTIIGYGVTVELDSGKKVNVTRDFEPQIGEMITVNMRVW